MAKKATLKIGADTKEAEAGLNKVASEINKIGKSSTVKGIKNIGQAFTGVTASLSAAIGTLKAVKSAMDECAAAYKTQAKAEKQLEVAAANNPYLSNVSVTRLKAFAGELQNISTVGDEVLLPLMAELAAAGRTEAEIQQILKAALDVSASGAMSLDSAVKNLNKTYGGTAGELAETIPEIKNLTKEELAQGKAVEIVAEKYKGMAEEVTNATGSYEQMKNAQGDFAEAIGKFNKPVQDQWNDLWKSFYQNGIETIGKLDTAITKSGMKRGLDSWVQKANERYVSDIDGDSKYGVAQMETQDLEILKSILENKKDITNEQQNALLLAKQELNYRSRVAAAEQKEAEQKAKNAQADRQIAETKKREKTADEKAAEAYKQYDETIAKKQAEIEWRRQAGEEISKEAEAQEMATAKLNAWFQMLEKADGTISGTKGKALEIMADIQQNFDEVAQTEELGKTLAKYEQKYQDFAKDVNKIFETTLKPSEVLSQQLDQMEQQWSDLTDNSIMWEQKSVEERQRLEEEYTAAHAELCRQREEALEAESETAVELAQSTEDQRMAKLESTMGKVQQLTSGFTNAVQAWANVAMQFVQAEKEEQLNALEEQYENGLISLEEYEEKKKQIEKEAAEEEYKIRLWEWTAQCVQAAADLASATIKAFKDGGIIQAILVAAAGSAQLAAVIGNKPVPPSGFASGGVVGGFNGASRGRDNTSAQVGLREGEMILNAQQQKTLFDTIAGGRMGGGFNGDIKIYNYAADSTNTDTEVTQDDIKIMITKQVKKDMANGVYNSEMKQAETTANGVRYTN
ncbi:MAG: hypothetical protein WC900_00065 [Oscillospiraceae bacterium]|jgi:hypothetical protein